MRTKFNEIKRVLLYVLALLLLSSFLQQRDHLSEFSNDGSEIPSILSSKEPVHVDVFTGGKEGYQIYRIPSVITTRAGTILAFAEGRASKSDHAENDIVLKRSPDDGKTWNDLQIIASDGKHCLNNPTAVEIRETGTILLMYQRYFSGFDERKAEPGYEGEKICRTYVISSDDDGVTWSEPAEVTREVKREKIVTSTATGPGVGIQLTRGDYSGRIIMPFNQGPYGNWKVYAAYSDDHGKRWQFGEVAPEGSDGLGNEVQMAEMPDGNIMLNSRSAFGNKLRKTAISKDGGGTWTGLVDHPELTEPQCMGSILRYSFGNVSEKSRILFSNPASQEKREKGTIRISYDEGKTWPVAKLIHTGFFAYSCLTKINDSKVGLLYEKDNYEKITFAIVDLEWLENEK